MSRVSLKWFADDFKKIVDYLKTSTSGSVTVKLNHSVLSFFAGSPLEELVEEMAMMKASAASSLNLRFDRIVQQYDQEKNTYKISDFVKTCEMIHTLSASPIKCGMTILNIGSSDPGTYVEDVLQHFLV